MDNAAGLEVAFYEIHCRYTYTHTLRSGDAYSTVQENITAASRRQLSYLAITDHGCAKPGGPNSWVPFTNQWVLPKAAEGVRMLYGIEADVIGPDGKLSVPGWVLDRLDWVIASMHADVMAPQTKRRSHTDVARHRRKPLCGCGRTYRRSDLFF